MLDLATVLVLDLEPLQPVGNSKLQQLLQNYTALEAAMWRRCFVELRQ